MRWGKRGIADERGMTILEVMIALVITGIVTAAIFEVYLTQHKNYIAQEEIVDIQQSVRASIDVMARNVRMAGYNLPIGIPPFEAYDTDPDTIVVYYDASDYNTYLATSMGNRTSDLALGSDPARFREEQWAYIWDPDSSYGEWFQIGEINRNTWRMRHRHGGFSRAYSAGALVLPITMMKFYIDNTSDPDHPDLMLETPGLAPMIFAENIRDLQFTYRMNNSLWVDEPTILENVREVKILITGRADRPQVVSTGEDTYRERTYTTSVNFRNIGT